MEELTLARYEAQGNDFLIALLTEHELRDFDTALDVIGLERSDLARVVCDRVLGAGSQPGYLHTRGADGFIIGVDRRPDLSVRMHLLNSDGSFAEISGNGLACLAQASLDAGLIGAGPLQPFETDAGEQRCTVWHENSSSLSNSTPSAPTVERFVEVAMPRVTEGPTVPPELEQRIHDDFSGNLRHFGTGDVGNPHLVIALASPPLGGNISELNTRADDLGELVAKLGATYQEHFPNGINVEFIWPYRVNPLNPEQAWALQMSVWERGAGLTVSCGSGSVVAATLAHRWGFVRSSSDSLPGSTEESSDATTPSSHRIDMRTAPFPGDNGSGFRYRVQTVPAPHEDFFKPQLGVEAERIETGLTFRPDQIPALLDDLAAMTEPKR